MPGNSVRAGSGAVPAQVNRQAVSEVMHSLLQAAQRPQDGHPVQDPPVWGDTGQHRTGTTLPATTSRTSCPTATADTSWHQLAPTAATGTGLPTAAAPDTASRAGAGT
jgi:hypothetical protein